MTAQLPDGNFINRRPFSLGLEDEEQRSRRILRVDWHQARVHLADIEWDFGQRLDAIFYNIRIYLASVSIKE